MCYWTTSVTGGHSCNTCDMEAHPTKHKELDVQSGIPSVTFAE